MNLGARGPKPEPTVLQLMKGKPGKRATNKREPKFKADGVHCPQFLDPVARKEWRRLQAELRRNELLTNGDVALYAAYCKEWAIYMQAVRDLDAYHGQMCLSQLLVAVMVDGKGDFRYLNGEFAKAGEDGVSADALDRAAKKGGGKPDKGKFRWMPVMREAEVPMYRALSVEKKAAFLHRRGMDIDEAEYYAEHGVQTNLEVNGYGIMTTTNGNMVQHPSLGIMRTAEKMLMQLAGEFGLSPSARARLNAPQAGDQLPLSLEERMNARAMQGAG